MPTRLFLVRHAEAKAHKDVEEAQWPLSSEGRRQAERLAADLALLDVDVLWSSPYPRAVDTVAPFASDRDLEIQIDHDLRERLFSPVWIDDFEIVLRQAFDDLDFSLPGGETGRECQERFLAALERIVQAHPDETIAVATHGNAIALVLGFLDPDVDFEFWKSIRNPDLFQLEWDGEFRWRRDFRLP